jgi:hypothetical protein
MTRNDGMVVWIVLAGERDVESLRPEGGRGLEFVGGSQLIEGLVGARRWR